MTSNTTRVLSAVALLAACGAASAADAGKATVGVSINATILTGLGLSVGTSLGEYFNVRGVGNGYSYSRDIEDDSGNYHGTVKLFSTGLLFDYQPFAGAFRLSAGLLSNGNKITLDGKPSATGEYDVGDCTYVPSTSDPLKVHGETGFKKMAPYAGIGWGGNMSAEPGFYGTFDIGVMFSGPANVKLGASGSARAKAGQNPSCGDSTTDHDVNNDPTFAPVFQAERQKAEDDANNQVGKYKLWPALGFGFGWRF